MWRQNKKDHSACMALAKLLILPATLSVIFSRLLKNFTSEGQMFICKRKQFYKPSLGTQNELFHTAALGRCLNVWPPVVTFSDKYEPESWLLTQRKKWMPVVLCIETIYCVKATELYMCHLSESSKHSTSRHNCDIISHWASAARSPELNRKHEETCYDLS